MFIQDKTNEEKEPDMDEMCDIVSGQNIVRLIFRNLMKGPPLLFSSDK